jgi:hypothetical protein
MSKINLAEYRVYSSGKDKTRTRRWTVSTFFGILSGRGEDVVYDASQTALKSALKSYKKKKKKKERRLLAAALLGHRDDLFYLLFPGMLFSLW